MELVAGRSSTHSLRSAKIDERPPFMTREDIERRIAAGGPKPYQVKEPWKGAFHTLPDIDELLDRLAQCSSLLCGYPMMCFAARTGVRRSESLRVEIADLDSQGKSVLIKEVEGKRQADDARVPLSAFLADTLSEWLADHFRGPYLFCNSGFVERSRTAGHVDMKTRTTTLSGRLASVMERKLPRSGPITEDEALDQPRALQAAVDGRWLGVGTLRATASTPIPRQGQRPAADRPMVQAYDG
jgi:integrase